METENETNAKQMHSEQNSDTPSDDRAVLMRGGICQAIYKKTVYDDGEINEKTIHDCTLKTHKQLNWFWRVISALHACGHACSGFPCMTDRGHADKQDENGAVKA